MEDAFTAVDDLAVYSALQEWVGIKHSIATERKVVLLGYEGHFQWKYLLIGTAKE